MSALTLINVVGASMQFQKNGITVSIDESEIRRLVLDRLNGAALDRVTAVPRIGEVWAGQGGIYAGVMRGRDGAPDYHLIVGPEFDGTINWTDATKWSASVSADGLTDFNLPYRKEQSLCFANVPELFQETWYWSREQHELYSDDYAWVQTFTNGSQTSWHKDNNLRARSVRRLVI